MRVEIIFHTSSTPKVFEDAKAVYTKGELLCISYGVDDLIKYPLANIFSVYSKHHYHGGSTLSKAPEQVTPTKIPTAHTLDIKDSK